MRTLSNHTKMETVHRISNETNLRVNTKLSMENLLLDSSGFVIFTPLKICSVWAIYYALCDHVICLFTLTCQNQQGVMD